MASWSEYVVAEIILQDPKMYTLPLGLKSFQDYGISLDERWHRETGLLYYEFIKGFIFQLDSLKKIELPTISEIVSGNVKIM